ncbi:MAG TPA: pyruvate kinase [Candidatus Omnitrophota bacterium]|nr:pyruvate kinase [Candidatus Omnitrophota bacterium]
MRRTKIIATIGPASFRFSVLKDMHSNGMDIARINTKYGNTGQYRKTLHNLKKLKNCEIMFDINSTKKIGWIKQQDFDYIALSYAGGKKQIRSIRKLFLPKQIRIISKIETKSGIKNIDEIIRESDGIMVARGDLGKNIPYKEVPVEQKIIIQKSRQKRKFVITATEMLLSLVKSKTPERAEISDVANAVIDGSDAVMLSEETAIGKHPVLAVRIMKDIVKYTEDNLKRLNDIYQF